MKKNYETPSLDVVKFCYSDQVVATSGGSKCGYKVGMNGPVEDGKCSDSDSLYPTQLV